MRSEITSVDAKNVANIQDESGGTHQTFDYLFNYPICICFQSTAQFKKKYIYHYTDLHIFGKIRI